MIWGLFATTLILSRVASAQNQTVVPTDSSLIYNWTPDGKAPLTQSDGLYNNCGTSTPVIMLMAMGDQITLHFTGTQAWVTLWLDHVGSNAQIGFDGDPGNEVPTTSNYVWYSRCQTILAGTGLRPFGNHTVSVVRSQDAGTALYVGNFIYDSTPVLPSTTAPTSSSPLPTANGTQSSSFATGPTSPTASTLPEVPGRKFSNAGPIGGGIAGAIVLILLGILGFFLSRRKKSIVHHDHSPIDLDRHTHSNHDIEPKPFNQFSNPSFSYATPWNPTEPASAVSPVTATLLPSSPSSPSVEVGSDPRGPYLTPSQPRASLSPTELIQSLVERNVPQAELAAAIRMLAASHPTEEAHSGGPVHSGSDAPPTYGSKEARRRE